MRIKSVSRKYAVLALLVYIAGCQPAPKPVEAPPPPVVVPPPPPPPPRPYPPAGAEPSTVIPPLGADGVWVTPNRNLSPEEHAWNYRSAINVAALTCKGNGWDEIVGNYNSMLTKFSKPLDRIYKNVDKEYIARYGATTAGKRARDTKTVELYNYLANPLVKRRFCDISLLKSRETLLQTSEAFPAFARSALDELDRVYIDFFDAYVQYQKDAAAWDAQYAVPKALPTPMPAPTS